MAKQKKRFASLRNDGTRILADGVFLSNNTWETNRNNNDLIIGPTGSGKTRSYVKPNLLNASESLVITDTKGSLADELGPALEKSGYNIQRLDFANPSRSIGYNPFEYVSRDPETLRYSQKGIATIAATLYGSDVCSRDPYWDLAATGLLRSIISAMFETEIPANHNIRTVSELFQMLNKRVGNNPRDNRYSFLMDDLLLSDPDSYAARQYYMVIDQNADRTAASVKMILGNAISQFQSEEIGEILLKKDRIDIKKLATRKTAIFLTISDMDRSQDKLANLFYTQALQTLCEYADRECEDHCLPVPVRFILDDFATNACIPNFDNHISVIRSRGISVSLILQSLTQLENMYGKYASTTILNGCDTTLYLGGQDLLTANYIGTRVNRPDYDILSMPLTDTWLMVRGEEPKLVKRYDLDNDPRYREAIALEHARRAEQKATEKPRKAKTNVVKPRRPENAQYDGFEYVDIGEVPF